MAATAYASLVSLLNTLDQIHTHPLVSTFFDINQTNSLSQKVNFFVDFVEKCSDADSKEVEDLVRRIADAAHEAENIIEVHAADRFRGGESPRFLHNLQKIIGKMESIKEVVIKVKAKIGKSRSFLHDPTPSSSSSVAAPPATAEATTVVGFDDYVDKLFNDLTGHDVARQIISITGMGGIGKTTLARKLYENSHIMLHFNIRVWVTVSQESSPRKVFLQALSCLAGGSIYMDTADDQKLSVELHKKLFNRRYLIVLDDVWSAEIWDKIKFYFPENHNGSRIVVTTRESKLVNHIGSSTLAVKFLDEGKSWKLFHEKTFPQQDFPSELKEVGKKILRKCGGLPLAISLVGGLLRKSPRTHEHWEKIVQDKSLILNLEENTPLSILYLSYKYLPACLKSCFLYLGLCPEDSNIDVVQLIKLWVAEGIIKANKDQSFEEVAESYFNDLAERNLLLLNASSPSWKSCSTHDLVRDLCIEIIGNENFFSTRRSIVGMRNFIEAWAVSPLLPIPIPGKIVSPFKTRLLRMYSCDRIWYFSHPIDIRDAPFETRLLEVLCLANRNPDIDAIQEVNMCFLCGDSSERRDCLLPSRLSQFWCLQTLIVRNVVIAPAEIWKMPQLRHIESDYLCLPPPTSDDDVCILENLHTLKTVKNLVFTEEVCKRIPNIKELDISCDYNRQPSYHLENLGCFNKLESLKYQCYMPEYCPYDLQNIKFPNSLKKLTLSSFCNLEWSYMAVIASLPHLESLYLDENAVAGTEWVFDDERFISLKVLHIECRYLEKWIAKSSNFPVLEELFVWDYRQQLDEIPSGIGDIPTLQSIYLKDCHDSANISAVEILYEQERFENMGLRLTIENRSWRNGAAQLRKKIEELGLTCQNLETEGVKTWKYRKKLGPLRS